MRPAAAPVLDCEAADDVAEPELSEEPDSLDSLVSLESEAELVRVPVGLPVVTVPLDPGPAAPVPMTMDEEPEPPTTPAGTVTSVGTDDADTSGFVRTGVGCVVTGVGCEVAGVG